MAYQITLTDGQLFATIPDGTINTSSAMTLVGKNYAGYGAFLDTNFIRLLESGSNSTPPTSPLTGQLWWDSTSNILKVWNGSIFKNIGGATASPTAPTNNVAGDLWFNTSANVLNVYTGTGFLTVGPSIINGTGTEIATIVDTNSVPHTVVETIVNNQIVSINSKDIAFTPATPISGFGNINPGVTIASSIAGVNQAFNGNLIGNTVYASGNLTGNNVTVNGNLILGNGPGSTILLPANGVNFTTNATPGFNGGSTVVNIVPNSNASPSSNGGGAAVLGMWNSADSNNAAVLIQSVYAINSTYPGSPPTYGEWRVGGGYSGNCYPISSYYFVPSTGPNSNIQTQIAFNASNVNVYGNLALPISSNIVATDQYLVVTGPTGSNTININMAVANSSSGGNGTCYLSQYINYTPNNQSVTSFSTQKRVLAPNEPSIGISGITSAHSGNGLPTNLFQVLTDSNNGTYNTGVNLSGDTVNIFGTSNVPSQPNASLFTQSTGGATQLRVFPGCGYSNATPGAGVSLNLPNNPDYQTVGALSSTTQLNGNGQPYGQLNLYGASYAPGNVFTGNGAIISRIIINPDTRTNAALTSLVGNVTIGYYPGTQLYVDGVLNVTGTKNFRVPHPITDGKDLVHSAIEGPQAYLVYRGIANLVSGTANVNIDNSAGMTPGTFVTIAKDAHVSHLQNHSSFDRVVPSAVTGNQFTITSENSASTDSIHWVVMAQRILDPSIRGVDGSGNLIVEPDAYVEDPLITPDHDWKPATDPVHRTPVDMTPPAQ